MGERNFTLLALNFDEVQIGPKTKVEADDEGDSSAGELAAPAGGGRSVPTPPVERKTLLAGLLGLGILGGLAVAAKVLLGGQEEGLDLEDPTADEEFESTEIED